MLASLRGMVPVHREEVEVVVATLVMAQHRRVS
jgi:hypothetical protein